MIGKVKRLIMGKISNILRSAVRSEIENALPIIPQLIEFQNSAEEDRQSFYDHTKNPLGSIGFYAGLKERSLLAGDPVKPPDIENVLSELKDGVRGQENVKGRKCLG